MSHFVLVTLHLLAAIMFVGTVFFEVFILEDIRDPLRHFLASDFTNSAMPPFDAALFVSTAHGMV